MCDPTFWVMRGLPGAGKSTTAKLLALTTPYTIVCSADDYFVGDDGVYRFDPKQLGAAHKACFDKALDAMKGKHPLVLDNTNTQHWEFAKYVGHARALGYNVVIVDVFDGGFSDHSLAQRNTHGVPEAAIAKMRARYEHNWRSCLPIPPWERTEPPAYVTRREANVRRAAAECRVDPAEDIQVSDDAACERVSGGYWVDARVFVWDHEVEEQA